MPSFLCLMTRVYLCTSDTLASFTIPSLLASKTLRIHSSFCHLLGSPLMSQETLPANRSRKSKCRVPLILKVASGFLFYQNWIDGTYSGLSVDSQVAQWTACQCRRHRRPGFHPWARKVSGGKWQPALVFLPGGTYCGQTSLVGYSPWGHKESDMTYWLITA